METISISQIWRYFRWAPPFVLRRIFTKERLAGMVLVDVRPRHRPVSVNVSDLGSFSIYFQIVNMSPFEVELDRADIKFNCAGVELRAMHIQKAVFKSGEIGFLYVYGQISDAQADSIAKLYEKNKSSITLYCDFNCKLHGFKLAHHNLDGVNVEFINAEYRRKQSEVHT